MRNGTTTRRITVGSTWSRVTFSRTREAASLGRQPVRRRRRALPIPGQELIDPMHGITGDAVKYVGEPGLVSEVARRFEFQLA